MSKKEHRFVKLKFNIFVFLLCVATVGLAYAFDRIHLSAKKAETQEMEKNKKINYVEKVQINKIKSATEPQASSDEALGESSTESSEDFDEGLVKDADAADYIFLYKETNSESEVLEQIFTGEWGTYLGDEGDFVKVRTNLGNQGYITKEQSNIIKLVDNAKPTALKDAVIVLDPGHGGNDVGAESTNQVYHEKNFTLATSKAVAKKLEEAGAKVYLTRSNDTYLDLDERTEISIERAPDAFISLHYDSFDTSDTMSGFTTYYYYQRDEILANAVNQGLVDQDLGNAEGTMPNLGVRTDNFSVTRENPYPSLLLELGYINSYHDLIIIWDDSYYEQVAEGITTGLTSYFASHKAE